MPSSSPTATRRPSIVDYYLHVEGLAEERNLATVHRLGVTVHDVEVYLPGS